MNTSKSTSKRSFYSFPQLPQDIIDEILSYDLLTCIEIVRLRGLSIDLRRMVDESSYWKRKGHEYIFTLNYRAYKSIYDVVHYMFQESSDLYLDVGTDNLNDFPFKIYSIIVFLPVNSDGQIDFPKIKNSIIRYFRRYHERFDWIIRTSWWLIRIDRFLCRGIRFLLSYLSTDPLFLFVFNYLRHFNLLNVLLASAIGCIILYFVILLVFAPSCTLVLIAFGFACFFLLLTLVGFSQLVDKKVIMRLLFKSKHDLPMIFSFYLIVVMEFIKSGIFSISPLAVIVAYNRRIIHDAMFWAEFRFVVYVIGMLTVVYCCYYPILFKLVDDLIAFYSVAHRDTQGSDNMPFKREDFLIYVLFNGFAIYFLISLCCGTINVLQALSAFLPFLAMKYLYPKLPRIYQEIYMMEEVHKQRKEIKLLLFFVGCFMVPLVIILFLNDLWRAVRLEQKGNI